MGNQRYVIAWEQGLGENSYAAPVGAKLEWTDQGWLMVWHENEICAAFPSGQVRRVILRETAQAEAA